MRPQHMMPSSRVVPLVVDDSDVIAVRVPTSARLRLADVLGYWPLIRAHATRDLKVRYKQAALGPAWLVFQPLALLAVFSFGFHSVAHVPTDGVPYGLFALTGIAIWTYFQAILMVSLTSIVGNYPIVRFTPCPRLTLPLSTLVSNLPTFVITTVAAVIAVGVAGYLWAGSLLLPLLCLWLFLLVTPICVAVAAITVRARDLVSVMPFLVQVILFLSPVAYGTAHLSGTLRAFVSINPLTGFLEAWRWSLLGTQPGAAAVVWSLGLTAVGAVVAWRLFARLEVVMADEI